MCDEYVDYYSMEPFETLTEHFQNVQKDFHKLGFQEREFKRSNLRYPYRVALGSIEYICSLLQDLKRLQSDETFTDVTIKVDGREFHGHRCVLAAASGYFEDMFSSGFKESKAKKVALKDMDGDIFAWIFEFMYCGQFFPDESNAIPALRAAAYLEVRNIEKLFIDYFTRCIEERCLFYEDALTVWDIADKHGMNELSATVYPQMLHNFQHLVERDLFLQKAPSKLIDEYLQRDNSPVRGSWMEEYLKLRLACGLSDDQHNNEQLLSRIIQWLKHDWENRKGDAYKLLQRFHLGLLPKDKVQELMDDQILEIPECKEMMDELIENWTEFQGVEDLLKLPESFLPRGIRRTLIAFGGKREIFIKKEYGYDSDDYTYRIDMLDKERELFCHYYNKTDRKWTRLHNLLLPDRAWKLEYPSLVVVNRDLYLAGGRRTNEADLYYEDDSDDEDASDYYDDDSTNVNESKRCFKLDGKSYKWTELPPMTHARSRFALVHHDGFLYAIGGIRDRYTLERDTDSRYSKTVERFNLSTQTWDCIYTLPVPMAYTSAAIVEGKILVYGLKDRVGGEECEFWLVGFDPVTHKWTKMVQERYTVKRSALVPKSVLVVHDGVCYRVKYEFCASDWSGSNPVPRVNRIKMKPVRSGKGGLKASIGREVKGQDTLPEDNRVGAFHIDGHIYINVCRFAHKIGAVVSDPNSDEALDGWKRLESMGTKCVVEYAFSSSIP